MLVLAPTFFDLHADPYPPISARSRGTDPAESDSLRKRQGTWTVMLLTQSSELWNVSGLPMQCFIMLQSLVEYAP